MNRLPKIDEIMKQTAGVTKATETDGTFSGFAAGLMGGGTSAFDRLIDNSDRTNELLETVAANTEDMGLNSTPDPRPIEDYAVGMYRRLSFAP